jgi:tetratricopeptide (TPR) repeat protein
MRECWYIATKRFGPHQEAEWKKYLAWSGLSHLRCVISLDGILCPPLVNELTAEDWQHNVQQDNFTDYFLDAGYLLHRIEVIDCDANLLAVVREPQEDCGNLAVGPGFYFRGYDLIETPTGVSALTNCGGFDLAFQPDDLNEFGLIPRYDAGRKIQQLLRDKYPEEAHAQCDLFALWSLETADLLRTTTDDETLRETFDRPEAARLHVRNLAAYLISVKDVLNRARPLAEIGYCQRILGNLPDASMHLQEALDLIADDPSYRRQRVIYTIRLGHVYHWQERWADAVTQFDIAWRQCVDHPDCHDLRDFVLQHRGKMHFDRRDYRAAGEDFVAALALREKKGAADLIASTRQALAMLEKIQC